MKTRPQLHQGGDLAGDFHSTPVGFQNLGENLQEGALPGTGGTDNGEVVACLDREVDAAEGRDRWLAGEHAPEIAQLHHRADDRFGLGLAEQHLGHPLVPSLASSLTGSVVSVVRVRRCRRVPVSEPTTTRSPSASRPSMGATSM